MRRRRLRLEEVGVMATAAVAAEVTAMAVAATAMVAGIMAMAATVEGGLVVVGMEGKEEIEEETEVAMGKGGDRRRRRRRRRWRMRRWWRRRGWRRRRC